MAKGKGSGCGTTLFLAFVLLAIRSITWDSDPMAGGDPLAIDQYGGDNPRRPPADSPYAERYEIADPGPAQDSQGTAFAIDDDRRWMTAQHVTHGCDRLALYDGDDLAFIGRVTESTVADAALIRDGPVDPEPLVLTRTLARTGTTGYHMGFPRGNPAIVTSTLLGNANARRGRGANEPVLAWAETDRYGIDNGSLGGISGGPTFDASGAVVGINSASTERRGRVLTAAPQSIFELASLGGPVDVPSVATPITGIADAQARFERWIGRGTIRQVYCDVR